MRGAVKACGWMVKDCALEGGGGYVCRCVKSGGVLTEDLLILSTLP
jgi:hypothetical protein